MSCPTCDATLEKITSECVADWFWCPRCGTLVQQVSRGELPYHVEIEPPKLVVRCRRFWEFPSTQGENPGWRDLWRMLGISESIYRRKDRPPGHEG
jgi:hypothetical protein